MASMLRSIRRKKSKAHEFRLTTTVASLTIECVKTWKPTKLVIVWNKECPKLSSTKPVRWQSGIKNPSRGIHVWPEPDPVQTKLTLVKNSGKELLQYQQKLWTILVQNGVIKCCLKRSYVTGLDIADYITEESSSHDITVTLRPATKNVVSGSLEFSLSSVLLEDGIPRRTDKEILDEILQDAVKSRKQSLLKTTISNGSAAPKTEKKNLAPAPPLSFKSRPAPPPPLSAKSRPAPPPPLPRKSRPAPPPPLPVKSRPAPPPPKPASSQSTSSKPRPPRPPPPSQPKQDVKVKNTLKHTEEKAANNGKRLSGLKGKVKYPKELNPFGSSSEDSLPYSQQTSKCVLGQEPGNEQEVKSSSSRRKRNRRKKKTDKYPKKFNPFGEESSNDEEGSLSSESESHPCKEKPEKDSKVLDGPGTCKDLDDRDGRGKGTNNGDVIVSKNDSGDIEQGGAVLLEISLVRDEPALEKEKPYFPGDSVSKLEQGNGDGSVKQKEKVDGHNSTPDDSPGTCKNLDEGDYKDKWTNDGDAIVPKNDSGDIEQGGAVLLETSLVQDEPALEKAEPYVPGDSVSKLEQGNGDESVKQKEEVDGHCRTSDGSPGTCKDLDEGDDKDKETNDGDAIVPKNNSGDIEQGGAVLLETSLVQDKPALEKANTYVPVNTVNELEHGNGERSSKQKEGLDGHCSTRDDGLSTCKDLDEGDGTEKSTNAGDATVPKNDSDDIEQGGAFLLETLLVQDEPDGLKQGSGEESSKQTEGIHGHCRTPDDPALSRKQPNKQEEEKSSEEKDRESALCSVSDECVQQTAKSSCPSVVKGELKEASGEGSVERKEGGDDPCSNSDDPVLNRKKPCDPVAGIKNVEEPRDEELSQEREGERGLCSIADEPVFRRAKPYVPVMSVEELQGAKYEEVARQQERDNGLWSTIDGPVLKRAKPYVPVSSDEELDEVKDEKIRKPQEEDNGLCSTSGKPVTKRSRPYVAVVVDKERVEDNGENSEAQRENEKAASLDSQHCIELSMYAQEQIAILCEESASLEKVSIKLEMELLQAMKTKDCEEELDGLTQDWLTLTKYRDELTERKQDLEILDKQRNFDDCCKIIRKELRFLLELEDWRKTDESRAHEQKLLTLLLQLINKKYSIAQLH